MTALLAIAYGAGGTAFGALLTLALWIIGLPVSPVFVLLVLGGIFGACLGLIIAGLVE